MADAMQPMTREEHDATERWFLETLDRLNLLALDIEDAIADALQAEQNAWLVAKGRVVGALSIVEAAQEAFFVRQTLVLRPPDESVIAETIRLSDALAAEIAKADRAKAALKLAGDLANFVARVVS
jgi:hypothetical protein